MAARAGSKASQVVRGGRSGVGVAGVFVCACCCSCSCKVVLEVKNANKIAAFGKEVLIRCEAHAEMTRSWQMDAR